ncbi:hypothetical protein Acr_07g0011550 [Actinidia rufa]|uniref:Uncharacterized protein n=1 Tax=Actinidia rufa TaxID=165716 RepID=A0A7J0EYB4_9ERIC|nr:hypothetical protein Acr_07g0011550 [Actinidia rufa]
MRFSHGSTARRCDSGNGWFDSADALLSPAMPSLHRSILLKLVDIFNAAVENVVVVIGAGGEAVDLRKGFGICSEK